MEPDYRYQNRQQNFNSAPAPVQQPVEVKKKKKGCPIAVVIICLILAIGGVGFGIFEMLTINNINQTPETPDSETSDCNCNCTNNGQNENEEKVVEIVEKLNQTYSEFMISNNIPNITTKTYSEIKPFIEIEDTSIYTRTSKSIGFRSINAVDSLEEHNDFIEVYKAIISKLTENGYEKDTYDGMFNTQYVNEDQKIVCALTNDSVPFMFSCSHTDWQSTEENIELTKQLGNAIRKKTGQEIITIETASEKKIKKSNYENYEIMTIGVSNAVGTFYRENENAEWNFMFAKQDEPGCEEYSELEKKIFAGNTCYNRETQQHEKL